MKQDYIKKFKIKSDTRRKLVGWADYVFVYRVATAN